MSKENTDALGHELATLFQRNAVELGREVAIDTVELQTYANRLLLKCAASVGQPDYREVLKTARDALALKAACVAVDNGDAADARLLGILESGLAVGARALALALVP